MQLRNARLCLDCEEVHDGLQCPVCASETFAYITRWVPTPETSSRRPRANESPDVEVYRQLVNNGDQPSRGKRLLKQGAFALTALGVIGWIWQTKGARASQTNLDEP
jgi:hypothetical protein